MNKPFIIAEMSANHLGSIDRARDIVMAAAAAGADAVKLQTWAPGMMCVRDYTIKTGPWAGMKLADLYAEAETPWEWHEELFELARQHGMIGFSSVFDLGALDFLESIGCPMYKISSFEMADTPLIQAVAQTGKPMIISTGMASFDEIATAWAWAGSSGCKDITLLKCTSAYPASPAASNLRQMLKMRSAFGSDRTRIGLSDHTQGIGVAVAAVAMGATVIEKHLTLSRADGGPDAGFSLEPNEFAQMVRECNSAYEAAYLEEDQPQHTDLRRSVYLARDVEPGQPIMPEDMVTARPNMGMPPGRMHWAIGKQHIQGGKAGQPLLETDLRKW